MLDGASRHHQKGQLLVEKEIRRCGRKFKSHLGHRERSQLRTQVLPTSFTMIPPVLCTTNTTSLRFPPYVEPGDGGEDLCNSSKLSRSCLPPEKISNWSCMMWPCSYAAIVLKPQTYTLELGHEFGRKSCGQYLVDVRVADFLSSRNCDRVRGRPLEVPEANRIVVVGLVGDFGDLIGEGSTLKMSRSWKCPGIAASVDERGRPGAGRVGLISPPLSRLWPRPASPFPLALNDLHGVASPASFPRDDNDTGGWLP